MGNCENILKVNSDSKENIEYVKNYFVNEWDCTVDIYDGDYLELSFISKSAFPEEELNKFLEGLPDKENISMTCLSVNWNWYYSAFYTFDGEENDNWQYCD